MKVKYIKDHATGKTGDIKDHPVAFAHYLMVKGTAIQVKEDKQIIETKEEKVEIETKEEKVTLKYKGDGKKVKPKEVSVKNVSK